jgi:hypothetical protein
MAGVAAVLAAAAVGGTIRARETLFRIREYVQWRL